MRIVLLMVAAIGLSAQSNQDPDSLVTVSRRFVSHEGLEKAQATGAFGAASDGTVTVQRKYVSSEGLATVKTALPETASQYVGLGKEIGVAVHEGLSAVVDDANKFSTTPVGKFVMVMIAFKIMGKQAMNVVVGIPIYVFGVILWIYLYRRMLMPHRVLIKQEGNTKVWEMKDPIDSAMWGKDYGEVKFAVLIAAWASIILWHLLMLMIIFGAFSS